MDKNNIDFFYHATGDNDKTYDTMLAIISDGAIKSRRMRNDVIGRSLFNGEDYISVAAWNDSFDKNSNDYLFNSSFLGFVFGLPCFIISGDIPAIKCEFRRGKPYDSSIERVSQYRDEWHVKDIIELDKVVGIALPKLQYTEQEKEKAKQILEYAKVYNWEIFVSDENLVESVRERFGKINTNSKTN